MSGTRSTLRYCRSGVIDSLRWNASNTAHEHTQSTVWRGQSWSEAKETQPIACLRGGNIDVSFSSG